jgi:transcription antitermination factor NusG
MPILDDDVESLISCLLSGFQIYLPRLHTWRISHGRKIETQPPLFPSYCFTFVELQWHAARWLPDVVSFIMDGLSPVQVPDAVIDDLEVGGLIELPQKQDLRRGDRVKILRGPFSGHFAIYADMKPRQRVEVRLKRTPRRVGHFPGEAALSTPIRTSGNADPTSTSAPAQPTHQRLARRL